MAEAHPAPSLPATADADHYLPISGMAVAAFAVSLLFVFLLAILGIDALWRKKPVLIEELFLLPAIAIVLSFAARRMVRNSEGTRTGTAFGIDLPAAAWWVAVVAGFGYGAYQLAIRYTVSRDAEAETQKFIDFVIADNVNRAFHRTLDPSQQANYSADDTSRIEAVFRDKVIAFRQSKLVRTARRNKGECRFEPGGLREWAYVPGGQTCTYTGTLVCPEGRFAFAVPLRTAEAVTGDKERSPGGRQWQVLGDPAGYVTSSTLTPYGWAVAEILSRGSSFGRAFLMALSHGRGAQLDAYIRFVLNGDPAADPVLAPLAISHAAARAAALGGWGQHVTIPQQWFDHTADKLFTNANGAAPPAEQKARFHPIWLSGGVLPAGARLTNSVDQGDTLTMTDAELDLAIPIELPVPGRDGEPSAARGRLVVACSDAPLLARLKALKAAANPDQTTEKPPADLGLPQASWRVVRVASDLVPVPLRAEAPPR